MKHKAKNSRVLKLSMVILCIILINFLDTEQRSLFAKSPNNYSIVSFKQAQQKTVQGVVTDNTGEPLPGVTIQIKGSNKGTITNPAGEYSLTNVPNDAILVFSFVGKETLEITVGNQSIIDVMLNEATIDIVEVVAIGYGKIERSQVTSSIATVSEDDFVQGPMYQSPLEMLSGRIAGLGISRSSGGDPTGGVEIQLRGLSSIRGSSSPLIVIDGIPGGTLNSITPENIASISVMRDGSAAAIYGSRATNGVILIETKEGKAGETKVSYSAYAYTERYFNKPDMITASEFRHYKEEFANSGDEYWEKKSDAMVDFGADNDWLDVISQNALSYVHNLSISGGSESTTYYGSVNYRDQQGILKESSQEIVNSKFSLKHSALDDKFHLGLNLHTSFTNKHPISESVMVLAMNMNPTAPVYNKDAPEDYIPFNPDGKYFETEERRNPLGFLEQYHRDYENLILLGSVKASYDITKSLTASVMGSYNRGNTFTGYYEDNDTWNVLTNTGYNRATRTSSRRLTRTLEPLLEYFKVLNNDQVIQAVAGYTFQDHIDENFSAENRGFEYNTFLYNRLEAGTFIEEGKYPDPISSYKEKSKLLAFFGRVNYSYQNKYMLSLSYRREGSSKFGSANKWGNFPAVSTGWNISREPFMENISFIDNLKIRAGWGVTGNQGVSNYLSLQRMGKYGYMLYNGEWVTGYSPASNPNPNLRWEKKDERNIGIDLTMFRNINITLDLYHRITTDLLYEYSVPVPPNIFPETWANVGRIDNKGIEISLNATPVRTENFSWRTDFNISYNENLLISLSDELYSHNYLNTGYLWGGDFAYRLEEGEAIGNIYGYEHAGFSEEERMFFVLDSTNNKILANEAKEEDKRIIGNGRPQSWLGFRNVFRYRNFDLTVDIKGAFFFDIVNITRIYHENHQGFPFRNIPKRAITDPDLYNLRDGSSYFTSYYIEPGDYIKLDNLTLGYNIPVKKIEKLRLYVSGKNLLCITNYTGQDPERNISGLNPGFDWYDTYPSVRTYSIGLNVNF